MEFVSHPIGSPEDPRVAELNRVRHLYELKCAETRQLLANLAPFARRYEELERKVCEYEQMEPALRGRIATLESMLAEGDDDLVPMQCEGCDAFFSRDQCEGCAGDESVCTGCCPYPYVHKHV